MSEPPTRFALRRSPALAAWLVAVHAGAILAAWASAMPGVAAGAVSVLAVGALVRSMRLHVLRSAACAVVWIELDPDLRLGFANGSVLGARVRGHPFIHPWLVSLPYESEGGPGVVLIPPDSLSSRAGHRAVRRCLRHGGPA